MGLIKCVDCGKQISSLAETCPFCGRPISNNENQNNKIPKPEQTVVKKSVVSKYKNYIIGAIILAVVIVAGIIITLTAKTTAVNWSGDEIECFESKSDFHHQTNLQLLFLLSK